MAIVRNTLLAATMIGAGVASMTGSAFASDHQDGAANLDNVQTIVPTNVCNNDVPINALGVQVPIQDVAGNIPVLSGAEHHSGSGAGVDKSCGNPVHAKN